VKHVRAALITTLAVTILLIVLANSLRPLLPWIFGLLIFGYIAKLLIRS
jgi:hypothetical protein